MSYGNYENIDSVEERIFPYYKGKYIGKDNVGYANVQAARKFMKDVPKEDIYNECFGGRDNYMRDNAYFLGLSNRPSQYKRQDPALLDYDLSKKYYLRVFDYNKQDEILRDIKTVVTNGLKISMDTALLFERKYNLYPLMWFDNAKFKKAYSKYVSNNVEFIKCKLHKTIELL